MSEEEPSTAPDSEHEPLDTRAEQRRREAEDAAMEARLVALDFAEEFQREGRPYVELDENGEVVWRYPNADA